MEARIAFNTNFFISKCITKLFTGHNSATQRLPLQLLIVMTVLYLITIKSLGWAFQYRLL